MGGDFKSFHCTPMKNQYKRLLDYRYVHWCKTVEGPALDRQFVPAVDEKKEVSNERRIGGPGTTTSL